MGAEDVRRRERRRWIGLAVALACCGCGYSIRPPYSPTIRTVYVPVFKSITFKRELNLQLTQLVQEEIRRRTPFKVVGDPEGADTTLDGTVNLAMKYASVENPNNFPRQIQASVQAQVRWIDNRNGDTKQRELPPVPVTENIAFFPEVGETSGLAYQRAIKRMAVQIVDMMEEPWFLPDELDPQAAGAPVTSPR